MKLPRNQVSTSPFLVHTQISKPYSEILSAISYTCAHKCPNKKNSLPLQAPNKHARKGANTTKPSNAKISSQVSGQSNMSCIQLKRQIRKPSQHGANGLVFLFDSYCFSFVYSYVTCQQNLLCSWTVCGTLISRRTAFLLLLPGAVITSTFTWQAVILWLSA